MNWGDRGWTPGIELSGAEAAFVEVIGIVATVTAACLAWAAIKQSGRHSREALNAIADERRRDFELDVLKELAEQVSLSAYIGDRDRAATLRLHLLPPDGLEVCRARFGLDGAEAQLALSGRPGSSGDALDDHEMADGRKVRQHMQDEVLVAIQTRLNERR